MTLPAGLPEVLVARYEREQRIGEQRRATDFEGRRAEALRIAQLRCDRYDKIDLRPYDPSAQLARGAITVREVNAALVAAGYGDFHVEYFPVGQLVLCDGSQDAGVGDDPGAWPAPPPALQQWPWSLDARTWLGR